MKHLLIMKNGESEDSPLTVAGMVHYDSTSHQYNPETKGFVEATPVDWITYVDVEDSVDVDVNYTAVKNADDSYSFTRPNYLQF